MYKTITKYLLVSAALMLFGASCIRFGGGSQPQGSQGGVFKSIDRGQLWQQKVALPTAAGVRNFGGADVTSFAIDPQDHLAVYVGTRENGLFYSYDGGESWMSAKQIASGYVASIAVDQKNKCRVYVAFANQILKTEDCSRTFQEVYRESIPQSFVTSVMIHPKNPSVLYASTTKGIVVKSIDAGHSWARLADFRTRVTSLALVPDNQNVVYVGAHDWGVWRGEGDDFKDLSAGLKAVRNGKDIRVLALDPSAPGTLIAASRNSISRTTDGGQTWSQLPIISPESVEIFTFALNPKNSKEMYYGTATTFYHSIDGGARWSTEKLPTRLQASAILIDPEKPEIIYLGVLQPAK